MEDNYLLKRLKNDLHEVEKVLDFKRSVIGQVEEIVSEKLIPVMVARKDGSEVIIAVEGNEENFISIPNEFGYDVVCLILSAFEYGGVNYCSLLPFDKELGEPKGDIALYRYQIDGNDDLINITSVGEDEWQEVYNFFDGLFDVPQTIG